MKPHGTGRKHIDIKPIEDISKRRVTFTKRRQGLFKKLDKLRAQTGCKALAITFSPAGRPFISGDLELLQHFDATTSSDDDDIGMTCAARTDDDDGNLGVGHEDNNLCVGLEDTNLLGGVVGEELPEGGDDLHQLEAELNRLVELKRNLAVGVIKGLQDRCFGVDSEAGDREADLPRLEAELNQFVQMRRKLEEKVKLQDHLNVEAAPLRIVPATEQELPMVRSTTASSPSLMMIEVPPSNGNGVS